MEAEVNETTPNLPSRVEESLSACPQFRIVLIGNSGVGKSSLVRSIFKIDLNDIDIAHERARRANIEREYSPKENTLHDSQAFEAGVERFLRRRRTLGLVTPLVTSSPAEDRDFVPSATPEPPSIPVSLHRLPETSSLTEDDESVPSATPEPSSIPVLLYRLPATSSSAEDDEFVPSATPEPPITVPPYRLPTASTTAANIEREYRSKPAQDIDIAHNRAGRANIEREYTSEENTRFILHNSRGFEAGSVDSWKTVERFLRLRSALTRAERVHAIWLCILTPREGTRLQQTGDENLLSLAKELNIPVIAVFTKFDELVNEQFLKALKARANLSETEAEQNAQHYFNERVRDFRRRMQVSVVRVSTSEDYTGRFESLLELTKVTRNCLGDNEEAGSVPFIIAQRVSTSQKVGLSVREGLKKYWLSLGNSTVFQGSTLNQCVWRIHDDILKVWNFNDPNKLLSGGKFYAKMILLVSPMLEGSESGFPQDDMFTKCLDVAALALTVASPFAIFLAAVGVSLLAVKFLYGTYKKIPSSARYLGAYITALTCILHLLFQETAASEQTNVLTEDLVLRTVAQYQRTQSIRHQNLLRGMNVLQGFEKKLAKLVLEETNTPETDSLTSPTDLASPTRNDRPSRLVIPSGNVGDRQGEQQSPQQKRSPVWMKNPFAKNS